MCDIAGANTPACPNRDASVVELLFQRLLIDRLLSRRRRRWELIALRTV
jgi:hypothetical protein